VRIFKGYDSAEGHEDMTVIGDSIVDMFTGYYFDDETGLYHVRHRRYLPALQRWLQRESVPVSREGVDFGSRRKGDQANLSCRDQPGSAKGMPVRLPPYRDSMDVYEYAGANPVTYFDPAGHGKLTEVLKEILLDSCAGWQGLGGNERDRYYLRYLHTDDDEGWLRCVRQNVRDRLGFRILCFG